MKSCQINLCNIFLTNDFVRFYSILLCPVSFPNHEIFCSSHNQNTGQHNTWVKRKTFFSLFPHFVWTAMHRTVQNKNTYALIQRALLPIFLSLTKKNNSEVRKYVQRCIIFSVNYLQYMPNTLH